MHPDCRGQLRVCGGNLAKNIHGASAIVHQLSCTLPPMEMFYHAAFLRFQPLIMIPLFWEMYLTTHWKISGRVLITRVSGNSIKLRHRRNVAGDVAFNGVCDWLLNDVNPNMSYDSPLQAASHWNHRLPDQYRWTWDPETFHRKVAQAFVPIGVGWG